MKELSGSSTDHVGGIMFVPDSVSYGIPRYLGVSFIPVLRFLVEMILSLTWLG